MSGSHYYGNVNLELLRWMPLTAKRVLELGCGEGALAAAYKRRNPKADYVAIEAHPPSAAIARDRVDLLIEADFTMLDGAAIADLGRFDAIVLGDVLEHMPDPWRVLRTLSGLLSYEGEIALSVPNVSHWSAMAKLMSGEWPAADSGIFDRTHLRFFTLSSLTNTLADCGMAVQRSRPRVFVGDRAEAEKWVPILAAAAEQAGQDKDAFLKRSQALQHVATACRQDSPPLPRMHLHFAVMAPSFMQARTSAPLEALESNAALTISSREKSTQLPEAPIHIPKVAVLQRLLMPKKDIETFVSAARAKRWTLVYEIDDHPDLIAKVQRSGDMGDGLRNLITYGCHAVQTSTPKLAEVLRALNPEVEVFENAVIDLPPFRPRKTTRVFYGALNREGFSAKVAAALAPAIAENPALEFIVLHDQAFFRALPTERKMLLKASPYTDYLTAMERADVVLSPLEGLETETYKSDIKFVEAGRAGAAMIASPCVYEEAIRHGETGFIARDLEDWSVYLARLAANPALRNVMAEAAWREVRDTRMMAYQVERRIDWYRSLCNRYDALDAALLDRSASVRQPEPA